MYLPSNGATAIDLDHDFVTRHDHDLVVRHDLSRSRILKCEYLENVERASEKL